jgi:hypothetical protein
MKLVCISAFHPTQHLGLASNGLPAFLAQLQQDVAKTHLFALLSICTHLST